MTNWRAWRGWTSFRRTSSLSRPVSGNNTFSTFTERESRTPDEHLREIVETLDRWKVEWCELDQ
jgi:hypothetical protein